MPKKDERYPSQQQPQFSVRIPNDLLEEVDDYCDRQGISKRDFAIAAFRMLLDSGEQLGSKSGEVSREEFNQLVQTVDSLVKQLAA